MNKYEVTVVWTDGASVKNNPNTGGGAADVFKQGEKFFASEIVPDNLDVSNTNKAWAKISEGLYAGKYVAVLYPSISRGAVRCTWKEVTTEPEPNNVIIPHALRVEFLDANKNPIGIERIFEIT